ncbi:hypothetical protein K435DRAFT_855877 [Dendrothele bispora CBS 962.96]|uniref:Uncharacterized protein n=1 Tax=Dendrothele bispora (strain CBS 962.96) TaxID=1314807 RepID=A0A4S8M9U8_DENBC|nr:hypothetical protein K435DRAFT_855877 [Dendrothele bispora CBS 962.96]
MSGLRTTLCILRDAPTNTSPSSPIHQVASANRLIVGAALASLRRSIKFFVDESCSSLTFFRLSTQEAPPEIPKSVTPFGSKPRPRMIVLLFLHHFIVSFGTLSPLSTLGADRLFDSSAHSRRSRNAAINDISVGSSHLLASYQLLSAKGPAQWDTLSPQTHPFLFPSPQPSHYFLDDFLSDFLSFLLSGPEHATAALSSASPRELTVQLRPSWSSTPGLLRRKSINGWGSPQAYPGSWDSPVFEQNVAEGVVPALPEGSLAAPIVSVAKHDQFDSDEEDQSDADMPPLQTPPDSESDSGVELVY